jgi:PHD/YefM family antitoxin component YafN of YafNO toxin-antitoxin module
MFRIDQIMTATQFVRSFREVANFLSRTSAPLLITQKNGRFLVVMDGEFFEGLMDTRARVLNNSMDPSSTITSDFKS